MTEKKKYPFYFYLLALLMPVFFFLMLEAGLRLTGYGETIPQWVQASKPYSKYLNLNPRIARRYFANLDQLPTPHYDGFLKDKTDNVFRVFIMGGSSAAGFPYPVNAAFSHYISRYLKNQYPDYIIEVINIALSAVNSYTLRDLFPGVLEQKPDLVIIYAGHNEYYGALGAGSSEFWGDTTLLVNFLLATRDIRTIQLLRKMITSVRDMISNNKRPQADATLMARMVGKQLIPLHSRVYLNGISQFRENMQDILTMAAGSRVPVLLSTVTSNLKDQPPFESVAIDSLPAADEIYRQAQQRYLAADYSSAEKLFLRARELDALRFRAPQAINQNILELAQEYNFPVVDIDSVFKANSPHHITGMTLMTDHVHPNLTGIGLIGAAMIDAMESNRFIPEEGKRKFSISEGKSGSADWSITELDSLYAERRLAFLKGGWPFMPLGTENAALRYFKAKNFLEEQALKIFLSDITWENAHVNVALWYKAQKNTAKFIHEINTLIAVMPFDESPYKILIDGLIELQAYDEAFKYLNILHTKKASAYSNKWLGILYLYQGDIEKAQKFLKSSLAIKNNDAQVLYNLAGTYIKQKEYDQAIALIEDCLAIDTGFPGAQKTYQDLKRIIRN